jgi:ketosteroid isomerase-like protein
MTKTPKQELVEQNQRLLDGIAKGDWNTYQTLCDESLTAFEPETLAQQMEGLAFHKAYFEVNATPVSHTTIMCSLKVRIIGDIGIVTYVRVNQRPEPEKKLINNSSMETRIWQKKAGQWKLIHFHRSRP